MAIHKTNMVRVYDLRDDRYKWVKTSELPKPYYGSLDIPKIDEPDLPNG